MKFTGFVQWEQAKRLHPCAEYAIIKSNIDVLFIVEMATMEGTFLYVRKYRQKPLRYVAEEGQIKTES